MLGLEELNWWKLAQIQESVLILWDLQNEFARIVEVRILKGLELTCGVRSVRRRGVGGQGWSAVGEERSRRAIGSSRGSVAEERDLVNVG